jgi:hypothetical protein
MLSPRLYIELYGNSTTTFGPTTLKALITDALHVGWSRYSRFPGSAFFTLRQESENNGLITPGLDHVRIWYQDAAQGYGPVLVFSGRVGDPDESGEDVVWTCWDYMAELSLSVSGFRRLYPAKKLGTEIAKPEWDDNSGDWLLYGAKVKTKSRSAHILTGTFEDPDDSLGDPIVTDARFGVIKVPRLLLLFDLSEMGRANTDNNVTYEITRSLTPTINFWANKGSLISGKRLTLPGSLNDFRRVPGVMQVRNRLATIGESLSGGAVAIEKEVADGQYGYNAFGLMEDVFSIKTLAGMSSSSTFDAQEKITQRAVIEATQLTAALELDVRPSYFLPFDGWEIEDRVVVQVEREGVSIDDEYRIVGVRGRMDQIGYRQALYVSPPIS